MSPADTPARADLATAGETMALMFPAESGRIRHARELRLKIGGAESNVAIAAARLGLASRWISRVGDDEFGHLVYAAVAGEGVDVSGVVRAPGERTGLYLREEVAGSVRTHYYREGSAASRLSPDSVGPALLVSADVLHLTGITPALSPQCAEFTRWAAATARAAGSTVSFDVNYRAKLWSPAAARGFLASITDEVDVLFVGQDEAETLWGATDAAAVARAADADDSMEIVVKHGAAGATRFRGGDRVTAAGFAVPGVVDPVGAGDAFAAGYLAARTWSGDVRSHLRVGNAMGAWCVMSAGDYEGLPDRRELEAFLNETEEPGR